jgi:hypothetical protein
MLVVAGLKRCGCSSRHCNAYFIQQIGSATHTRSDYTIAQYLDLSQSLADGRVMD